MNVRIYVLEELKEFRLLIRRARSDSKRKLDKKVKASSTASIAAIPAKNTSYHLLLIQDGETALIMALKNVIKICWVKIQKLVLQRVMLL